jgi:uncharacterized membrane protein YidH (DUF202 family)
MSEPARNDGNRFFWIYSAIGSLLLIGVGLDGVRNQVWYGTIVSVGFNAKVIGTIVIVLGVGLLVLSVVRIYRR